MNAIATQVEEGKFARFLEVKDSLDLHPVLDLIEASDSEDETPPGKR